METFDELAHSFKLRLCNALHICDRMAAFLQYLIYLIFWYLLMVLSVHAHSVQYCYILCHLVHLFCHKHAYLYLTKPIFFVQHCRIIRVYTLRMVNVVLDGRIKVRVFGF